MEWAPAGLASQRAPAYYAAIMRRRFDPALFWFLCVFATLAVGCWWIAQNIAGSGIRVQAFFGMLIITAVAFQAGTTRFNKDHR